MSKHLLSCFKDLELISKYNEKDRQKLLKILSKNPKYYLGLKEIAVNLIKGNIDLEPKVKRKLLKQRKVIRKFTKNNNKIQRKKIVIQSGGWLWILPIIQSILSLV